MTDRIGQQLGNYRLVRLLGEGGFAHVYLGEHIHLHTHAAIKLLHMQVADTDKDSFLTEAQTIAKLDHPNIVRVLDFDVQDGIPFLVMNYAPKGTLRQRHPKGAQLPLPMIVTYVTQVADALQYAHEKKIIHRDVKPENMLMGRRDEILLSDFGIALISQTSHSEDVKDTVGTVAYMAPEQIQGKPRPASDQYSLAVVLYEWLCGKRPFYGSFTEICTQHLFASPPSLCKQLPTLPADVEAVIMTALAKDPKQRFASIQAFARAFRQASRPETTHTFLEGTDKLRRVSASRAPSSDLDVVDQASTPEVAPAEQVTLLDNASTVPVELSNGTPDQPGMLVPSATGLPMVHRDKRPLAFIVLFVALLIVLIGGTLFAYPAISTYNAHVQATAIASMSTATVQASQTPPTPNPIPTDFAFTKITQKGGQALSNKEPVAISVKQLPLTITGTYASQGSEQVWIVVEDVYGQYYLQPLPVRFADGGQEGVWRVDNVYTNIGTVRINFVSVTQQGNDFFQKMSDANDYQAFKQLPAGSKTVLVIPIQVTQ